MALNETVVIDCGFFMCQFLTVLSFLNLLYLNNRYKDANPVDPSSTVGIFNDGTELRISTIRHEDIGDYTCIARNGEGQVSHTARVIIAGGAVIMVKTIHSDCIYRNQIQQMITYTHPNKSTT